MLDINFIRENPKLIKEECLKKGVDFDIDLFLKIDKEKRENLQMLEEISAKKNKSTKLIPTLKTEEEKKEIIQEMREIDKEGDKIKERLKKLDEDFETMVCQIPNLCNCNVPVGKDEKSNIVLKEEGKKPNFRFQPKDYLELSKELDLIDIERASKVSGSRFGYIKNQAAVLEIALINYAFEKLIKEGFVPVIPPVLIKPEMMKAMGYIDTQKDRDERYFLEKDNLYLVGTSEQSVGPMHKDEIMEHLPKRYVIFSTCFREEAGSYGKDTKGILRVHQFDKVEMFSFTKPEDSEKEHMFLVSIEEKLMKSLKIPYRLVQLCSGDLARPSSATLDIESWFPGQNEYRETHSSSNCTDFQARRLNIRYKEESGKLNFVHTLNGTVFAIGRMLIAIIENYQQKDGSIKVPKVLQKYTGFKAITCKRK